MQRIFHTAFIALFILSATLRPEAVQARSAPDSFADLAEKLLPAVVNISTTQTITAKDEMPDLEFQFPQGSPFEDFFREFMEKNREQRGMKKGHKQKSTSLGSGFIIDEKGYIVTNNHVIDGAEEINVILHDDTNLTAKVVGRDKKTDLAVLKVETKKPLPFVKLGDSDKARVGDWIIAIGNPFGLGGTVTVGILSARARDINSGPYDDYLQTDAPINRGNSGGPMFNMDGEVIGINTAIFSPTGGSVGIGFAIPSTLAKTVINQLKTSGHTRRGWLGVRIQVVTDEIADSLDIGKARGALVSSVTKDSPASDAKFETGDVIVSFDGKDVPDMQRLPRIVAETEVGKTVDVTIIRKGKKQSLRVKVGELSSADESDEEETEVKEPQKDISATTIKTLGLDVAEISDALRTRYDLEKGIKGLVVTSVDPEALAVEYGIMEGDIISEAAQKEMKDPKELQKLADEAKKSKKPLLLLIDRQGDLRFVAVSFKGK